MSNQAIEKLSDQIIETGKEFQGIYGKYTITKTDKKEVQFYRFSLLICGISLSICLIHRDTCNKLTCKPDISYLLLF